MAAKTPTKSPSKSASSACFVALSALAGSIRALNAPSALAGSIRALATLLPRGGGNTLRRSGYVLGPGGPLRAYAYAFVRVLGGRARNALARSIALAILSSSYSVSKTFAEAVQIARAFFLVHCARFLDSPFRLHRLRESTCAPEYRPKTAMARLRRFHKSADGSGNASSRDTAWLALSRRKTNGALRSKRARRGNFGAEANFLRIPR